MSDIVWVVNPTKDSLVDLTQRMRQIADDALTARGIAFHLNAHDERVSIKLAAGVRREIFRIFKEGINNLMRHSGCTEAEIDFKVEENWLVLKLADNGRGFDPLTPREGNGLASMRRRAESLHAEFQIHSLHGRGTTLILRVPLRTAERSSFP